MVSLREIPTPALVLDLDVLEHNVERMAARAEELDVALRPHVKTHKCAEIARMQRDHGARGLTVSTLEEARFFAERGFDDLTWAFPVIPSRVPEVIELASRVRLGVTVDSMEAVELLDATRTPLRVWLEVDSGQHRSGVDPASERAVAIGRAIHDSPTLRFEGVLTHAGHSYACRRGQGLAEVAESERENAVLLADRLRDAGVSVEHVSVGSTPTMSAVRDLTGVTEMRPGNYVFHDYTQTIIGSCTLEDCAVTVLASVVSRAPGEGRSVIDAGALALSKDVSPSGAPATMGRIFTADGARLREDAHVRSLSQEHGLVEGELDTHARVRVLPNHSCLAAACFDRYHVVRGDRLVDLWPIHRAR
jgi:D-serine deaminase-like pyridoxal phosphate-dependent protein